MNIKPVKEEYPNVARLWKILSSAQKGLLLSLHLMHEINRENVNEYLCTGKVSDEGREIFRIYIRDILEATEHATDENSLDWIPCGILRRLEKLLVQSPNTDLSEIIFGLIPNGKAILWRP
ncbi:MAG: hypothetical protein WCV59_01635 [Parcubacteria group bacterium]